MTRLCREELAPIPDIIPYCLQVLYVEDDNADAYLIQKALSDNPRVGAIVRARDGLEAIEILDSGSVEPDLMIVDLNMPRKNGFSLLVELACRGEPRVPTVVLTSSKARSDVTRSMLRGASIFLAKPDTFEELGDALNRVVAAV